MKYDFTVVNQPEGEVRFEMTRSPFVIGRKENCDFQLDSRTVSRQHCEFKVKRAGLTIKDLSSRNGTLINGEKIQPQIRVVIRQGDVLRLGKYTIKVGGLIESIAGNPENELDASNSSSPHEKLMASLETLVFENHESATGFPENKPTGFDETSTATWKTLHHSADTPAAAKSADHLDESEQSDESSVGSDSTGSAETVAVNGDDSATIDPAEKRRLELRARLASMKAKDSKEAANRALKNFFGRR
jgi:pSer/pThr/pTyr-binding forkhead associated (FHA) protein